MILILTKRPGYGPVLLLATMLMATGTLGAADGSNADDIATLKAQVAAQQKQLEELRLAIANQQKLLERAVAAIQPAATQPAPTQPARPARLGEVTSLTPIVPNAPVVPTLPVAAAQAPRAAAGNPCEEGYEGNSVPPYLRLGSICVQPVGFMDMTMVWRDKDAGTNIGTNFAGVPYNNSLPTARLPEFRFSPQNSRIGFRIDGNWKGAHFIGYNEFDFLSGANPANIGVTNGAFVPRLRLYWVDVRTGKFEFLAGQSWSMLTPNRSGLSALPSDLFYSQVMDVNYVAGLTWTRQPGVRFIYHPTDKIAMGVSLENPTQYAGGTNGSGAFTPPAALTAVVGSQLDNASGSYFTTPTVIPDIIAKVAFDPNPRVHFEMAGLISTFKVWNPTITTSNVYSTTAGGGGSINGNFEIAKGFRLITNNFYGNGGGRYMFGSAPDVVLAADGTLHTLTSGGFVEGIEWNTRKFLWFGYFGDIYIDRYALLDANGKTNIGYGYPQSPNNQNRNIQEITFGWIQTLWKDPRFGALSLINQYEYMLRYPWAVTGTNPKSAHDNTVYIDVRYTLPGSMPRF